jgi:hypothetical protein
MQYLRDMFGGHVKLAPLDNARFPELRWTPVRAVLAAHVAPPEAPPRGAARPGARVTG